MPLSLYHIEIKAHISTWSTGVPCNTVYSDKKLETEWIPISRVMDGFWYSHTEEYYAAIKKNVQIIYVDVKGFLWCTFK